VQALAFEDDFGFAVFHEGLRLGRIATLGEDSAGFA
jgi:hypothetical protein